MGDICHFHRSYCRRNIAFALSTIPHNYHLIHLSYFRRECYFEGTCFAYGYSFWLIPYIAHYEFISRERTQGKTPIQISSRTCMRWLYYYRRTREGLLVFIGNDPRNGYFLCQHRDAEQQNTNANDVFHYTKI